MFYVEQMIKIAKKMAGTVIFFNAKQYKSVGYI